MQQNAKSAIQPLRGSDHAFLKTETHRRNRHINLVQNAVLANVSQNGQMGQKKVIADTPPHLGYQKNSQNAVEVTAASSTSSKTASIDVRRPNAPQVNESIENIEQPGASSPYSVQINNTNQSALTNATRRKSVEKVQPSNAGSVIPNAVQVEMGEIQNLNDTLVSSVQAANDQLGLNSILNDHHQNTMSQSSLGSWQLLRAISRPVLPERPHKLEVYFTEVYRIARELMNLMEDLIVFICRLLPSWIPYRFTDPADRREFTVGRADPLRQGGEWFLQLHTMGHPIRCALPYPLQTECLVLNGERHYCPEPFVPLTPSSSEPAPRTIPPWSLPPLSVIPPGHPVLFCESPSSSVAKLNEATPERRICLPPFSQLTSEGICSPRMDEAHLSDEEPQPRVKWVTERRRRHSA